MNITAEPAEGLNRENIGRLVRTFYGKARLESHIGPVFQAAVEDWEHHLEHLTDFWCMVVLRDGRFRGSPMAAHARQPIRPEMFDTWLGLWRQSAHEVFTPPIADEFICRAERIAESFKLGLFFRPEDEAPRV